MRWSVAGVIAESGVSAGWWGSLRELTVVEKAIGRRRSDGQCELQKGLRGELRNIVLQFAQDADVAKAEIKARKLVVGNADDAEGRGWKQRVIYIIKRDFGQDVFDRINAEARAYVEELTKTRDTPMSAGSVLAPIGGSGGMKSRE